MSNIKFVVALGAVATWVGLFACSSSGTNSCLVGAFGSDCFSCMQTSCAPELSNIESACSDYYSCLCPHGSFSCSENESSVCNPKGDVLACTNASKSMGTCVLQNCGTPCGGGGPFCPLGTGTTTTCAGSASLDGGTCTNGQLLESCSTTTGSTTSCYYKVGSQQFDCSSCTDTTRCEEAANAACR